MPHDCRFHNCVPCNPWEEGVHNFRHRGRAEACDCDRCPQERPPYPDYPPGRIWKRTVPSDPSVRDGSPGARAEPPPPMAGSNAYR